MLVSIKRNRKTGKLNYSVENLIAILEELNAQGVGTSFDRSMVSSKNVSALKKAGFYWNVWTLNSASDARIARKAGVDYITTDRPLHIRQKLK